MDLPEANSTTVRDLYCLWAACPCLSWSAVAMRALITWVVFVPQASFTPTLMRQRAGHIACTKGLHEIFKYAHLKFTVYSRKHTYIHTTSVNAVTLVWGSLRLTPITGGQYYSASYNRKDACNMKIGFEDSNTYAYKSLWTWYTVILYILQYYWQHNILSAVAT